MKMPFLLLIVVELLPFCAHAQKLEKITEVKLEYWRAFHGDITQEISVSESGKIAVTSTTSTSDPHTGISPKKGR